MQAKDNIHDGGLSAAEDQTKARPPAGPNRDPSILHTTTYKAFIKELERLISNIQILNDVAEGYRDNLSAAEHASQRNSMPSALPVVRTEYARKDKPTLTLLHVLVLVAVAGLVVVGIDTAIYSR